MPPKTTPRVKGNVRAANSSRAAELASTSSTGSLLSMSQLGGFAQFATPAFTASSTYVASTAPRSAPSRSGSSSPALSGSGSPATFGGLDAEVVSVIRNGELSMIIKRLMSKRDTTTKVRALEDLEKWIKAQPEDDETGIVACQEAIGPWIKLYIKLTTDVDRRVRLMTNNVHLLLVKRIKKKLAPYLKEVVAAWIGTFFDPTRDVARVALEAFKSAFPDNKREQVVSFCLQDIIYYISEILLNKTPETLSDPRFNTKEEMETRYARVASSSLYTLGYIIDTLSPEALEKGSSDIGPLLDEAQLWALFGHGNALVRRASYSTLRTITSKAPGLIRERLSIVSKHFFATAFSDKDMTTHGDLWDALLVFTKAFPESWTITAGKKPTMALFLGFLKAAGYGSVTITYRSVLPLIASWSDDSVLGKNGTGFPFVKDFFDNFWKGFEHPNIEKELGSTAVFLEAYIECLVYFIVRFGKSDATKQGQDAVFAAFLNLVKMYLASTDNEKTSVKFSQEELGVSKKISVHMLRLLNIPSVRERALNELWQPLVDIMSEIISSEPTDIYVKRGKRIVMLLGQIAALAHDKQDRAVSELAEKAADQLVQIVARQCSETQSFGPSQLLSSFAVHFEVVVFSNPASQKAMHEFFDLQFADMLLSSEDQKSSDDVVIESGESLPHLLDLFTGYLGSTQEQELASQIWQRVMDKVLKETDNAQDQERQRVILQGLFDRTSHTPPAFDLKLDSINSFVTDIVAEKQYEGSMSGKELIAKAMCSRSIISDTLKLEIFDSLAQRLDLFLSDVMGGHALGKKDEAASILDITVKSFSNIAPLAIENGTEDPLKQVVRAVFDLSFQSEDHLGEAGQLNMDELRRLSEESEDLHFLLRECLTDHIRDCIQNMHRFTSPEDLARQAHKLTDILNLTDLSERFGLLSAFFFDKDHWDSLYREMSSSGPNPSMVMLDPVVEAYYAQKEVPVASTEEHLPRIYDGFGLSAYGRLALFTFEILKKEDANVSLFLSFPEKMTWIIGELLKVRQGCLDSFQTPSSEAGIFYSPNLHADANGVVFRTLLRELGTMASSWITLALEENWESLAIETLNGGKQGADDDDEDESGCNVAYFAQEALKEQDGFSERILADVLHALAQSDTTEISSASTKGWCQLLKSATLPLSISTGLVIALRKRLENTSEFTNLLNQWITEPTRPSEVSIHNKVTSRRLTLLVAALTSSSDDSPSINLPQLRAINLLQSVRRWVTDSDALHDFDSESELLIHSLLLKLLEALAYQVQELPGAHWEMMFDYITSVFSGLGEADPSPFVMTVLERACQLTLRLIELGEEEDDILSAWEEHSEGILMSAMRLNGRDDSSKSTSIRMDRPVRQFLEAVSQVCGHAPDRLILSHVSITEQCRLLMEPLTALQMLAYKQLQIILIEQVQTLSIQMEIKAPSSPSMDLAEEEGVETDGAALEDKMTKPKFPASLWAIISSPPKGFPATDVNVDADDERNLREEFSLLSSSHHHEDEDDEDEEYGVGAGVAATSEKIMSHAVLGYLMAWKLAFAIFENTTYTVKSLLVEQLRTSSTMDEFLPYLFHLLGIHSASSLVSDLSSSSGNQVASASSADAQQAEPFDLSRWDITDYQVTGFDLSSPEIGFPLLAGHLYYTCLANVPSLVRIWWTECKLRQLSIAIETLTERYFSPLLIVRELNSLVKAQRAPAQGSQAAAAAALSGVSDDLNELQIKTSKATSEVTASFQIDEATMAIVIRLPPNFPLRQVEVEGLQRVGVKEARWRAWLLAVAGVIAAQNGSLIDALSLFRRNVGLHFEGVEDCTICYSIVSLQDRSLPNKTCKTCKHRFHASCLYKWFRTSNSSSCPLCRTLW
ncbi:hypothetical protein BGX28_008102 [Mortierella sp. GBA30]|nr:hypothetical protein BGX28_008102 [Mortierella sp. GBA30]